MSSLRWSLGGLDSTSQSGTLGRNGSLRRSGSFGQAGTLQRLSGELSSLSTLMMERAEATEHSDNIGSLYLELTAARDGTGSYQPGETIRGEVWITANTSTHIAALNVRVKGRCHISIQPKNSAKPIEAEQSYLKDTVVLVEKDGGMSLEPGLSKIPFSYPLPKNVPSSFLGKHGSIVYDMSVELHEGNRDQPLSTNKQFSVSRPLPVDRGQTNTISKSRSAVVLHQACFPGRMYAQVKINSRHHAPNSDLICNARTWNNSNRPIKTTNAGIRMTSKYTNRKGKSKTVTQYVCRKTDGWEIERGEGRVWKDVALRIPPYLPDSQLTGCDLITVQYHFVFSITTARKAKRPLELVIPITIGAALPPATALAHELDQLSAYGSLNYSESVRSGSIRPGSSMGDSMMSIREASSSDDETQSQVQMNMDRHAAIKQYVEQQRTAGNSSHADDIGDHLQTLQARMVIQAVDDYKGKDRKIISRKKYAAPTVEDPYIDNRTLVTQTLMDDTQTADTPTDTPTDGQTTNTLTVDVHAEDTEENGLNHDSDEEAKSQTSEATSEQPESPNLNGQELSTEWDTSEQPESPNLNGQELSTEWDQMEEIQNSNEINGFIPHRVSTIEEENESVRNSNLEESWNEVNGNLSNGHPDEREGELFSHRLWKKQLQELDSDERNALEAFSVIHATDF